MYLKRYLDEIPGKKYTMGQLKRVARLYNHMMENTDKRCRISNIIFGFIDHYNAPMGSIKNEAKFQKKMKNRF